MTDRELWREIMYYGEFDRMPVIHWTGWPETIERWKKEGMPADVETREEERKFLNASPHCVGVGVNLDLYPLFDEETLEETAEYRIFRDSGGVIQQDWKDKSCIPHFIDFTLKTAADWPEFKKRLQPDEARIPGDLESRIAAAEQSGCPIAVETASMMGWIRNWMGVVNMSYLMYDDPDCYADMVDTIARLVCWGIDVVAPGVKTGIDFGFGWEDICGKNGPLVSPPIFERCVAPGCRKIRAKLEEYGVDLLAVDCDGYVEPLIPHWLEAGVNVQFPIEIGTWNADPMALRGRFGKELRIIGGFNKLALEKGPAEIDAEIERRLGLAAEGGFVMMPDHLITPGASLADYTYYLEKVRRLRF